VVGSSVTTAQQEFVKKSLDSGDTFFHNTLGRDVEAFTVYVDADRESLAQRFASVEGWSVDSARTFWQTTVAAAGQRRMWVSLGSQNWIETPDFGRTKILVHELFHLLQQQLAGACMYIGYVAVAAAGLYRLEDVRSSWISFTRQVPTPLSAMETSNGFYPARYPYSVGPLAVDFLVGKASPRELVDYYSAIGGGVPWRSAFAAAFGKSVDSFYGEFETYRRGL
jgi:hypothetical protein